MKTKSWVAVIITLLLIAASIFVTTQDITLGNPKNPVLKWTSLVNRIKQGLDLKGGVLIIYEAQADKVTDEQMQTALSVIDKRLASKGYFDATLTRQGNKQIRVEIPGIKDTKKAIDEIGKTAKLTLVDSEGKLVVDGKDIVDAAYQFGQTATNAPNQHYVSVRINKQAQKSFAQATERVLKLAAQQKNFIAIMLDEEAISTPQVSEKIDSDTFIISGNFTEESAKDLANLIRSGALPFKLDPVRNTEIGAKLGQEALQSSITAGIIAMTLVVIFMAVLYRVPGIVANISLLVYITIVLAVMGLLGMTITLPGIAGIILSIGMAVDANVIIFARLKEELEAGKSLMASIDTAFKRAFSAILDGNVTTLIAAAVLLWLGTAQIKGFAIVLGIGVLTSMFTALTVTRFLLNHTVHIVGRNKKLYTYGKVD